MLPVHISFVQYLNRAEPINVYEFAEEYFAGYVFRLGEITGIDITEALAIAIYEVSLSGTLMRFTQQKAIQKSPVGM